jgi:predicted dienelactone hydrolase
MMDGGMPYDPFLRGPYPVGVTTIQVADSVRNRVFPCEIWYPADSKYAGEDLAWDTQDVYTVPMRVQPRRQSAVRGAAGESGRFPLVVFSHGSAVGGRRMAAYLCTHLSSHGYLVAAIDHSELVAPELVRRDNETAEERTTRVDGWISSRVPDIRFMLDHLLGMAEWPSGIAVDPTEIGIVGYSFGGWTALAAPEADRRIQVVAALAPAGSTKRKPGIIPVTLTFAWGRPVPTLYLVAEQDTALPLEGMYELYDRTPSGKQMVILRKADHSHFLENAEQEHEAFRTMAVNGDLAKMLQAMQPFADLCSEEQAHLYARGLTVCQMDANLKQRAGAQRFLSGDVEAELASRGIAAKVRGTAWNR